MHDGQEDGEDDEPDGTAHDDDHEGFEHGGEGVDFDADLIFVFFGDGIEHVFESSCALAHADHVCHEWRELARSFEGGGEGFAFFDVVVCLFDDFSEDGVSEDGFDDVEGFEEGDAAGEEGGEGFGETGDGDHADDAAKDGEFEEDGVPGHAAFGGGRPFFEGVEGADGEEDDEPPEMGDEIGGGEEEFGDAGEFFSLLFEEFGDSWDDEDEEEHHEEDADDDHDHGVDHGAGDSGFESELGFEESGEAFEDDVEASGGFACADHADVEGVEEFGVLGHGGGEGGAFADL